jgi:hypothetical protein
MSTKPRGSGQSVDRLQAENDFLRRGGFAEEIGKTVRVLLICLAVVGIVYLLGHAVETLAGKETEANIFVNLLGKLEISFVLSWIVGGAGLAYGLSQKKLRKSTVERLQKRIKELEADIDPTRTSSKLTPSGDTNPEDR